MNRLLLLGNLLSKGVGILSRVHIPILSRGLNVAFVKVFGINMDGAEHQISGYKTIEDIFTRRLKSGARPITGPIAVPADGVWSQGGHVVESDQAIQVKGLTYSLSELVGFKHERPFTYFSTVYLAPHNYHRVHSPIAGNLRALLYIPGAVWPVNKPLVRYLPRLFNRNERLVFQIEAENGGTVYVVMVGALNVARMVTPFWRGFASNDNFAHRNQQIKALEQPIGLEVGDELGTFMLGSTAVVVCDDKAMEIYDEICGDLPRGRPVRMGEALAP